MPLSTDAAEPIAEAVPMDVGEPALRVEVEEPEALPVPVDVREPETAAPPSGPLGDTAKLEAFRSSRDVASEVISPPEDVRPLTALPLSVDIAEPAAALPMDVGESEGAPQSLDIVEPATVALPADDREPEAAPLPVDVSEPETQRPPAEIEAPTALPLLADAAESAAVGPSADLGEPDVLPLSVDISNSESVQPRVDNQPPRAVPLPADVAEPAAVPLPADAWEPGIPQLPVDVQEPPLAAPVQEPDSASRPVCVQRPESVPVPVYARESEVARPQAQELEPETVAFPVYFQESETVQLSAYPDVEMPCPSGESVDSVTLTTAVELAAQHGLDIIGFDGPNVDTYVVREVTAAVVDMLTRYPIALRGIRITDPDDSAPAIGGPSPALPQSDASAIWMVLDGGALATLVPEAGSARPRRWLRRRRNADRPVYAAVVREYGCALDVAGDFRARHEAQRRLITESLRGSAGLAYNPLDPSLALLDAFTDVALHGDRAGKLAKELHDMLVKMARAESTDLSA